MGGGGSCLSRDREFHTCFTFISTILTAVLTDPLPKDPAFMHLKGQCHVQT